MNEPRLRWWHNPVFWGGVLVTLITQVVYLKTLTISCPFWDSGEFIATSYVMGIPHPPGTPLYVLIGRFFSLLPLFSEISARINYLSAFGATLTALFTYLVIVRLVRRWVQRNATGVDQLIAIGAGVTGAFFCAFGRTFWDNAIEAEVYALSSFVMVLCTYLALCWEESGPAGGRNNNLLLLIGYLLFVTIGIHMGTFLVAVPIFVFVLLVSPRTMFPWDAGGTVARVGVIIALLLVAKVAGMGTVIATSLAITLFLAMIAHRVWNDGFRFRNLALWLGLLAIVGLTVQLFLIVRANLDPSINEADPYTWENLWLVLSRDQYKPPDPFQHRQAPWDIQFTKHFWRYWENQYHLGFRPQAVATTVPFLLGIVGMVAHFMKDRIEIAKGKTERPLAGALRLLRERRRFVFVFLLMFFTTIFLVFYLNFRTDEVRDRDYFFVAAFHFFGIWMGLGAAAIAHWLRGEPRIEEGRVLEPSGGRLFGVGTVVIFCILSMLPVRQGWHAHDRSDFLVARDYAYNMLMPLEEDAIIFTNGDNDTFPLWYLQEVEGLRKDVRVVNLSLLNTHWYIRQLRDYEPKIKIGLRDDEIDQLYGFRTPDGEVVMVKDIMVRQILREHLGERPVYLAVTVPDQMKLEKNMVMEGLAFRFETEEGEPERIDVDRTWKNLRETFLYRGLLDEEGYYDHSVYKDENARKLIQNYVAAYVRVAHHHLRNRDDARALEALEYAHRINPAFPGVLYTRGYLWLEQERYAEAQVAFEELITLGDNAPEVFRLLGNALEGQNRIGEAEAIYRDGIRANPEKFDAYRVLFSFLWAMGRREEGTEVIEGWLARHPDDDLTRQALQDLIDAPPDSGVGIGQP